jgi:hypothetical protein
MKSEIVKLLKKAGIRYQVNSGRIKIYVSVIANIYIFEMLAKTGYPDENASVWLGTYNAKVLAKEINLISEFIATLINLADDDKQYKALTELCYLWMSSVVDNAQTGQGSKFMLYNNILSQIGSKINNSEKFYECIKEISND